MLYRYWGSTRIVFIALGVEYRQAARMVKLTCSLSEQALSCVAKQRRQLVRTGVHTSCSGLSCPEYCTQHAFGVLLQKVCRLATSYSGLDIGIRQAVDAYKLEREPVTCDAGLPWLWVMPCPCSTTAGAECVEWRFCLGVVLVGSRGDPRVRKTDPGSAGSCC